MQPRTKFQFDVISRSSELQKINGFILEWVKSKCIEYKGYATKNRVVCMYCGEKFSPELIKRKRAVCPHCSTKLKIKASRCTTDKLELYTAYAQIVGEYQVIRYFIHYCYFKAGTKARINCWEVVQLWIKENGKYEIIARNHRQNNYCDAWTGDMEIRSENRTYYSYYGGHKYDIYAEFYHPESQIKGIYTKYGINTKLAGLTFIEAIRKVPATPRLETLLKCKQYNLLNLFYNGQTLSDRFWSAIKICIRNKYMIKDAKIWTDYIDLLLYFRKDIHNAKYVCPANLNKEHDRLVKKKRDIQRKQEAEEKKKKVQKWEKQFNEMKAHLLGVCFSDGLITIKTLDSVQEYLEEGDALHHCLFTNEYFLKKGSICLSARINEKPIETIEVSLSKLKVEQCRGLRNSNSNYHDRILKLVNSNLSIFKKKVKQPQHVQLTQ